ncbi:hypothetical protein TWF106_011034 [Orbilia oligospora]|uniref:Laccase n=1 Tax=Orbilia oligospora TaxID=2813651 RepID=A0A6G1MEN0_ORBOL|nr:hypothetical protein TWF106_011034 [Orbilia oligospora]KAF3254897.1 hypothetical protein TWF192_002981 [Orbilia oligospora]
MSLWKETLFSSWLVICQFFGINKYTPEIFRIDEIKGHLIPSILHSPSLYKNPSSLGPEDRSTYTCDGDADFKSKINSLRPPENSITCNTPDTRQTWCNITSGNVQDRNPKINNICFDYETPVYTGERIGLPNGVDKIKKITVEITYGDIWPDGYRKENAMLVNGKYPGELIEAYWGQTIEFTVINKLGVNPGEIRNGTAIHPHGLRLWGNPRNDGVPGITQCPIPFTFKQSSHLSLQYPNGIVGPMILHGPKSGNYDIDIGAILLTDWYHENPFSLYSEALKRAQVADSTLINGKGKFDCSSVTEKGRCRGGSYWETTFESGKWHLLRFVNTATSEMFRVSIDNHNMTVITADFTSVRPSKPVKFIDIAIGQRYEVLVYGTYAEGDFWLRSEPLNCSKGGKQIKKENVARGIIRYNRNSGEDPTSKTHLRTADLPKNCQDVEIENIVPVLSRDNHYVEFEEVYNASRKLQVSLVTPKNEERAARLELGKQVPFRNNTSSEPPLDSGERLWQIYGIPMRLDWSNPALDMLNEDSKPTDFPESYTVIEARPDGGDDMNKVVFHISGNAAPGTPGGTMHPIHIHGHDFIILAQGSGKFDEESTSRALFNPVRRDVATMPPDGYLIISFPVDNNGMWLLHCHLAWHASQGLALMVLERTEGVQGPTLTRTQKLSGENCQRWKAYISASPTPNPMDDSGI